LSHKHSPFPKWLLKCASKKEILSYISLFVNIESCGFWRFIYNKIQMFLKKWNTALSQAHTCRHINVIQNWFEVKRTVKCTSYTLCVKFCNFAIFTKTELLKKTSVERNKKLTIYSLYRSKHFWGHANGSTILFCSIILKC